MAAALPLIAGESGLSRYLAEIKRFPMLEPQEEYMLAKRWREHDDRQLKRLTRITKTFKQVDTKKRRSAVCFFQTTEKSDASTTFRPR
jgi:DNA-directed RNA polymerase sigma subunit (sigma70/sigma32)